MAFTRIRRYIAASIHEGLDHLEEPVVMIKQFMRELKNKMRSTEEAIEKQQRMHRTLEKDLKIAEELISRREQQARAAVDAGEEELARKALYSKKQAYEQVLRYQALLETSAQQIVTRKEELEELEKKYVALRDKKMELMLRVQAAKANEDLKRNRSSFTNQTKAIEDGFDRIEERVAEMEFHTVTDFSNAKANQTAYAEEIEAEIAKLKESSRQG